MHMYVVASVLIVTLTHSHSGSAFHNFMWYGDEGPQRKKLLILKLMDLLSSVLSTS